MKPEMFLQCEFAKWLDSIGVLYCASAGGMRVNIRTAVNMKRSGYKKGYPDIGIFEPTERHNGLFIELKAGNTKPTAEQNQWQIELERRGYKAIIMPTGLEFQEGLNWLKKIVEDYLNA